MFLGSGRITAHVLRVLSIMIVLHVNSATAFTLPLPCLYRHGPVRAQTVRAQGVSRMRMAAIKVALIQTGGTIDKDYPRSSMGYAFEIADPATERIIADASHVPLSVDFEQHTVCRKVETLTAGLTFDIKLLKFIELFSNVFIRACTHITQT